MFLQNIQLQNFRSFQKLHVDLGENVTLLVGANGSGKTSILEAIGVLATGQSFRAEHIEEMVQIGVELGRVSGKVELGGQEQDATNTGDVGKEVTQEEVELEAMLTRGEVQGRRTSKRLLSVNGVRRRLQDFVGKFSVVVFRPEDMRLIEGSPSRRRTFLDSPLCSLSLDYARSLHTYEQSLLRRNKLLYAIREGEAPRTTLTYWTESILKHGQFLQEQRQLMLATFLHSPFPLGFRITYQPSLISEDRLQNYAEKEIQAGHTLIGPHKDDFIVTFLLDPTNSVQKKSFPSSIDTPTVPIATKSSMTEPKTQSITARSLTQDAEEPTAASQFDVAAYGSRGQQRLAVLWLKLCELYFLQEQTGHRPLLLLDDILSELDTDSRELVLNIMKDGQSIITTASHGIAQRIEKTFSKCQKTVL